MASGFNLIAPYGYAWAVTPSDSADLAKQTRALWIGGTGDVRISTYDPVTQNAAAVTIQSVPAGTLLTVATNRVYLTGTDATEIVALA